MRSTTLQTARRAVHGDASEVCAPSFIWLSYGRSSLYGLRHGQACMDTNLITRIPDCSPPCQKLHLNGYPTHASSLSIMPDIDMLLSEPSTTCSHCHHLPCFPCSLVATTMLCRQVLGAKAVMAETSVKQQEAAPLLPMVKSSESIKP